MIPTFKMHGSKARSAAWVVQFFPRRFGRLIEPFGGRGNIFFRACHDCQFEQVLLNDTYTGPFLRALRDYAGDYDFVDEGPIGEAEWRRWMEAPPSHERALAESYVARFGSSFKIGPAKAGGDSENGHSRANTIRRFRRAGHLLRERRAQITDGDWLDFLRGVELREGDLVYLDPPYDVAQSVHYDNIDHDALIALVRELPCPVYVSGYSSPRLEAGFRDWNRETKSRSSVGKGVAHAGASGKKPRVEEVLWWKGPPLADCLDLFG
jgi:site-specific DNA-adenine methylase